MSDIYTETGRMWSDAARSASTGEDGGAPSAGGRKFMGFWSWIVDKLTEGSPARTARREDDLRDTVAHATDAVAVLDGEQGSDAAGGGTLETPWWALVGETLTEPPPVERPDLSMEGRALENLLVSHFDGHNLTLPPLLHVAERVLPKLSDSRCDLRTVGHVLGEDQVVAAAVLRMANSPLYRGLHKITALRPAVTRLGVRALRTLLMHESLRAAMFTRRGAGHVYARGIWRRALASACIMHGLSEFTTLDTDDATLIGLLHDIGCVMVLRIVLGDKLAPRYDIDDATFEFLCYECHQEFGELIADAWSLPPELKSLLSDHHQYPQPDDPLRIERVMIELTDMINALLGYAPYQPYDLLRSRAVADLGLARNAEFLSFLETLPGQVCETVEML